MDESLAPAPSESPSRAARVHEVCFWTLPDFIATPHVGEFGKNQDIEKEKFALPVLTFIVCIF